MTVNIHSANFLYSCPSISLMKPMGPEIAFIGRSNSGKSSLINVLLAKGLAKTSKTPGRTRHAVVYECTVAQKDDARIAILVDLPGFGYANMSKTEAADSQDLFWDYLAYRRELKTIFLLIDIRREVDERELEIIASCKKKGIKLFLVLTKSDKIVKSKRKPLMAKVAANLLLPKENILSHSVFDNDSAEQIKEEIYKTTLNPKDISAY